MVDNAGCHVQIPRWLLAFNAGDAHERDAHIVRWESAINV